MLQSWCGGRCGFRIGPSLIRHRRWRDYTLTPVAVWSDARNSRRHAEGESRTAQPLPSLNWSLDENGTGNTLESVVSTKVQVGAASNVRAPWKKRVYRDSAASMVLRRCRWADESTVIQITLAPPAQVTKTRWPLGCVGQVLQSLRMVRTTAITTVAAAVEFLGARF